MLLRRPFLAAAFLCITGHVHAAEIGSEGDTVNLQVHGFASQGFILTSANNYLAYSKNGSAEFTEVGVNFTAPLTEKLRAGVQLFARKLGPLGSYNIKADWFYLDYRFADWLGFRAGRTKLPFGLYNEINDIDSARAPILLPQAVYPTQNRDFLLAQTGAELYGRLDSHSAGALDYRLYGGTIFIDPTTSLNSGPFQVQNLTVPFVVGGRLLWETPLEGFRLGGSVQALRLDTDVLLRANPGLGAADVEIPAVLWVASTEYAAHDWLFALEYSRWHVKADSNNSAVFPGSSVVTSERAYAMAAYRATSWFQSSLYYSLLYPNVDKRDGRENMQHDVAATVRFDVNPYWLFKVELHGMWGTAGLDPTLNGNTPLSQLDRFWGVFLAKTTAYF